jgi:hypothetical protein
MVREAASMTLPYTFRGQRWWSPVQFGYAAKPWWKFEHLQWFNRILMPICRRFDPVEAAS